MVVSWWIVAFCPVYDHTISPDDYGRSPWPFFNHSCNPLPVICWLYVSASSFVSPVLPSHSCIVDNGIADNDIVLLWLCFSSHWHRWFSEGILPSPDLISQHCKSLM